MSFSDTLDHVANSISDHLPDILLGTSMAAGIGATIYGVAVTPKALDIIMDWVADNVPAEQRAGLKISELHKLLPFKLKVKLLWKLYLPVVIGMGISVGTGIASDVIHDRREAAYAALATVAETTLRDFKDSAKEIAGEKKYDQIAADVAQKQVDRAQIENQEIFYVNKKTEGFKVVDDITGRIYVVDRDQLDEAERYLNKRIYSWQFVTINDLYRHLGVPPVKIGEDLGWDSQDGDIDILGEMRPGLYEGVPVGVLNLINNLRIRTSSYESIRIRG